MLDIKLPTDFTAEELKRKIAKKLGIKEFSYTIEKQSLDAREKGNIYWNIRVGVSSAALPGPGALPHETFSIPYKKRDQKVVVVGSGPAGFFAAYTLLLAGFEVTLLEQGPDVDTRVKDIASFERTGELVENSNYAFGEGGAGTFSDGKLTSRTKSISREREFIFDIYIKGGAPEEIAYLAHPHLGSDNLRKIVKRLRQDFMEKGGQFLFDAKVENIDLVNGKMRAVETAAGKIAAQYFIFAVGHSSYDTYRMLMRKGVPFRVKPFAIGCRVEHAQELINLAQWGQASLPGLKAAEYRLTFQKPNLLPVYSFCMCPGGKVVPAAAYKGANIVNGMSNYSRNSVFGNAAVVAGVHINELLNKESEPLEALEWLQRLEERFFQVSNSYAAPACKIGDFLSGKVSAVFSKSSYPFALAPADFNELLPVKVIESLKEGMKDFCRKLRGFEEGVMLGLESKTSSLVQAVRDKGGRSDAVQNLYISGEGSGYAGGIVSSAADGVKAALDIISKGG
ncbi:MAG: NAD(P)-binding protein [Candidatus Aminicenantes bacterium]|nr:NAD(P)-binding protein [Candidatus Aminicenantes bacterium]